MAICVSRKSLLRRRAGCCYSLLLAFVICSCCAAHDDERRIEHAYPESDKVARARLSAEDHPELSSTGWVRALLGEAAVAPQKEEEEVVEGHASTSQLRREDVPTEARLRLENGLETATKHLEEGAGHAREWDSAAITADDLESMRSIVVIQKEGIIYCPIAKSASGEWKRSLRWMIGVEDWEGEHSQLYKIVNNGLERLVDRGLVETRWAFRSDRLFRFVVVRDPAERLVSAFLNKCVNEGHLSRQVRPMGSASCAYLDLMPGLFPNGTEASVATHQQLVALIEENPEEVYFNFVSGVWRDMKKAGDPCKILNHHFRPQACFCNLPKLLPAFHVIPFSNISGEAAALADKLPAAMPLPSNGGEDAGNREEGGEGGEVGGEGGVRETGVDAARREEIRAFLSARFETSMDVEKKITGSAERKLVFLSKRVMEITHQMFESDYELLGEYIPQPPPPTGGEDTQA